MNKEKIKEEEKNVEQEYKEKLKLKYKVLGIKLTKKKLKIKILAYLLNEQNLNNIQECKFYIDEKLYKKCDLKQYKTKIPNKEIMKNIYSFTFEIKDIIEDDSIINGAIRFGVKIDETEVNYKIGIKNKKIKAPKYYNLPMQSIYIKDFAIHIRRTIYGNLVLVKRKIEPIEQTLKFKIYESKIVSFLMYNIGKIGTKIRRKKINIFYEKFAEKAEEGVFELFQKCKQSKKTKSYFVIDEKKPDYEKIKEEPNVIKKYTFKYYWTIYNASRFIGSETGMHLNVLRSNNKYLRKAIYDKKLIFLQHGIIYMKNLGINSSFVKGKEGESEYIIVSSEKEKQVVSEMLKYDKEQILTTGLAMYGKLKYKHINQNSEDYITIMLTWKPYEEQLYNFEESSYYKNLVDIYNNLKKHIDKEKIIIISHPKAEKLLINTDMKESLWKRPISEALEKTKLLITDYSSICYNAFYQGAGVIFYQPDLEKYEQENGKLIPREDEYIGKRIFSIEELENTMKEIIENKKIKMDKVRIKQFEDNYHLINEFNDGKNIDRIYKKLVELKLI